MHLIFLFCIDLILYACKIFIRAVFGWEEEEFFMEKFSRVWEKFLKKWAQGGAQRGDP